MYVCVYGYGYVKHSLVGMEREEEEEGVEGKSWNWRDDLRGV